MAKQFLIHNKEYAGDNIQGQRAAQEDDFGFDNSKASDFLMILADGMGGHQGGDYASHCAIKTFMDSYHIATGEVDKRLWRALHETNCQLGIEAKTKSELNGMGCTLVGAVFNGKQLEWISVGDSPLWLYHAGQLRRLNADHSMKPILQEMVQGGELTPEEAARHPNRNMLRSALTGSQIDLIDYPSVPLALYPGDKLLLASDGIFTLSEREIGKILQKEGSARQLVKEILKTIEDKKRPGQDNTTILVIKIKDELLAIEKKKPKFWRWQINVLFLLLIISILGLWIFNG